MYHFNTKYADSKAEETNADKEQTILWWHISATR